MERKYYDFEKINILEYAFGEGERANKKEYSLYAFIIVDNCERPLTCVHFECVLLGQKHGCYT